MYERADETLLEGARKSGLSLDLGETGRFAYTAPQSSKPSGISEGDKLNLQLGAVSIADRLREVTLSWTAEGGFQSRPRVGEKSDDPDLLVARMVKSIIRSIRIKNTEV